MDARTRSSPMSLTEAAVLLAAIGWGAAFVAVSHGAPPLPEEPYASCADKSAGEACTAEYRSAAVEGLCLREAGSPLYCHPRAVHAREVPIAPAILAEPARAEHHASR